ncbi:hypothetical protein NM208_g8543 [Fusarium decemcellulare]|uniref:Uncharacterized protein n=1 Tax=Fusarium decemcellulare TaxID=57161 RepID=A0ACC1S4X7_9HYPO|nr:hypothetical protein NM208_g8543 [Fusarium decemcellulare]
MDTNMTTPPTEIYRPDASPQITLNEFGFEDGDIMEQFTESVPHRDSGPRTTVEGGRHAASDRSPSSDGVGEPTTPRQQAGENNAEGPLQNIEKSHQESSDHNPPFATSQTFEEQLNIDLPSAFPLGENSQQHDFGDGEDFDMFSYGLGPIPLPNDLQLSFNVMDCLDFGDSNLPLSLPAMDMESTSIDPSSSGLMAVSTGQMKQIRRVWSRQRPKIPTRLIKRLWNRVVHHKADNIFAIPLASSHTPDPSTSDNPQTSRISMDEQCRSRLVQYCKDLDDSSTSSSPAPDITFPVVEILDSSLDFFFQFFHPILPFMHKSTFDAKNTPSSLLLAMCLVGLSYLDRVHTRAFVTRYLKKLMPACLNDMTSQTLTQCAPSELLATLASALIVVYLALGFRDEVDDCQAYMLCAQMLRIADKQGLFAANQGDDLAVGLRQGPTDPDGFWKSWARVESIKRLIFCFTWLDMAYARLMNTAGVIEMDRVDLHLPCDDALFDGSTTAASFLHAIQQGARLTMPRMNIRNFHAISPSKLNDNSAQILLRALYLKTIAARTRLLDEDTQYSELQSVSPVEELAKDGSAKAIIADVLLLPTTHASVLSGRNRTNALGWNYLCITLTADVDLLEVAAGRDGLEAASSALVHVEKWSRSTSARRAVLHAAQVFDILDSYRIRESHLTRPDLVLFISALVISQYILVSSQKDVRLDAPTFELLQDIDWTTVRDDGLGTATGHILSDTVLDLERGPASSSAARCFLQNGGPISFAGEVQRFGDVAARKIARKFAHLMDGFGKWDGSNYSQLLRAMCGFMDGDDREYYGEK